MEENKIKKEELDKILEFKNNLYNLSKYISIL